MDVLNMNSMINYYIYVQQNFKKNDSEWRLTVHITKLISYHTCILILPQ